MPRRKLDNTVETQLDPVLQRLLWLRAHGFDVDACAWMVPTRKNSALAASSLKTYNQRLRNYLWEHDWLPGTSEHVAYRDAAAQLVTERTKEDLLALGADVQQEHGDGVPDRRVELYMRRYFREGKAPGPETSLSWSVSHRIADSLKPDQIDRLVSYGPSQSLVDDKWLIHTLECCAPRWMKDSRLSSKVGTLVEHWSQPERQLHTQGVSGEVIELGLLCGYLGLNETSERLQKIHLKSLASGTHIESYSYWLRRYYGGPKNTARNMVRHLHRDWVQPLFKASELLVLASVLPLANQISRGAYVLLVEEVDCALDCASETCSALEGSDRSAFTQAFSPTEKVLLRMRAELLDEAHRWRESQYLPDS